MDLNKHYLRAILFSLLIILGLLGLSVQTALAHTRVEVGSYVLVIGWAEEPVIVGERNAILLEVMEDKTPITGLEATLDLTILYAGHSFIGNLSPTGTPGVYAAEIYPTVRGQYTVQLTGMIGDTAVDEQLEPEEVLSANVLQFPEAQPDLLDLQNSVDDLDSRLQTAYILAIVGTVFGVVGIGIALFALFRRQKP